MNSWMDLFWIAQGDYPAQARLASAAWAAAADTRHCENLAINSWNLQGLLFQLDYYGLPISEAAIAAVQP